MNFPVPLYKCGWKPRTLVSSWNCPTAQFHYPDWKKHQSTVVNKRRPACCSFVVIQFICISRRCCPNLLAGKKAIGDSDTSVQIKWLYVSYGMQARAAMWTQRTGRINNHHFKELSRSVSPYLIFFFMCIWSYFCSRSVHRVQFTQKNLQVSQWFPILTLTSRRVTCSAINWALKGWAPAHRFLRWFTCYMLTLFFFFFPLFSLVVTQIFSILWWDGPHCLYLSTDPARSLLWAGWDGFPDGSIDYQV